MTKRILCVFLTLVLSIGMLWACKKTSGMPDGAVEDDNTNKDKEDAGEMPAYHFGYTCINMDNPYFESLKLSIETAVRESGSTLTVYDPAGDSAQQLEQINQMIEEGVDAAFVCPVDWEAIQPGIDALREADIPIINIDTEVKDIDHVTAYVGSDNKNAGYVCGEDLLIRKRNGGRIVVLESKNMNSVIDRITGFEEAIAGGGFEVVERVDAMGEKERARTEVERILAANDVIDAIMCGNDQMALGALEAVTAADRSDILIYGVDGSPEIKAEIAKGTSPVIGTGAQSPINIGKTAVDTALAILNGDEFEKMTYEETFLINRSNVELYGTDGWQ
ncbi:MAG: sugar ABC transporter substrate-binding protein [Hespellia sp.]|nr:sugar ABC transporter substrate-binding protein [Hespellia sp.]